MYRSAAVELPLADVLLFIKVIVEVYVFVHMLPVF